MSDLRSCCAPCASTRSSPGAIVLGWRRHPVWPVLHNLRRARAAQRASGQAVLLVRGAVHLHYRHALFPTDFSAASLALLRKAIGLLPPLSYTLLHARHVCGDGYLQAAGVGVPTVDACLQRAERRARAAGARFVRQVQPCDTRLLWLPLRQPWASAVAACAGLAGADLLILDGAAGSAWQRWRQAARLRALSARTACDLLLLPPGCAST